MRLADGEENRNKPLPGRWMLEIRHEADDGWENSEDDVEPDARLFNPVENASSTLYIVLWKSETDTAAIWRDAWNNYSEDWPDDETDPSQVDPDSGLRAISVSRELADLASIEDIVAMANEARQKGRELLGLDLPDLTTLDN